MPHLFPTHCFVLTDRLVVVQREPGRSNARTIPIAGRGDVPLLFLPRREGDPLWGTAAAEARDAGNREVIDALLLMLGDGVAREVDPASFLTPPLRAIREAVLRGTMDEGTPVPLRVHFHPAVMERARPPVLGAIREAGFDPLPTAPLPEAFVAGARMKELVSAGRRVLVVDAGFGNVHLSVVVANTPIRTEMTRELPGVVAAELADARAELLAELLVRRAAREAQQALPSDIERAAVIKLVPQAREWLSTLDEAGLVRQSIFLAALGRSYIVQVRAEELEQTQTQARRRLLAELDAALKDQPFDEVRIVASALWSEELRAQLERRMQGQVHRAWEELLDLASAGGDEYVAPVTSSEASPVVVPLPPPPPPPPPPVGGRSTVPIGAARAPRGDAPAVGTLMRGVVDTISRRSIIKLSTGDLAVFNGRSVPLPSGGTYDLRVEDEVEVKVTGVEPDGRPTVQVLPPVRDVGARPSVADAPTSDRYEPVDASEVSRVRVLPWHRGKVWGVALSPDGTQVISGGDDSAVQLREVVSGARTLLGSAHEKAVFGVAWAPKGDRFVSVSGDNTARIWRASDGREVRTLTGHRSWVQAVAWSPDGSCIATGGADRTVRLWNAQSGEMLDTIDMGSLRVRGLAFSPTGDRLAAVGSDAIIRLIDLDTRQTVELTGHTASVVHVAWSPDGYGLASAGKDGEILLWQIARRESVALMGHRGEVAGLTFSPAGTLLLSVGGDQTLREWRVQRPSEPPSVRTLHVAGLTAISLSADAGWCAVGTDDGKVILIKREQTERAKAPASAPSASPVAPPAAPPAAPTAILTTANGEVRVTMDAAPASWPSAPPPPPSPSASTPPPPPPAGAATPWETVPPSDAVPEATEEITSFDQLMDEIESFAAIDIGLRHLISLFGAERRGRKVVARIKEGFEDVGLGYSDAIELANIDSVVRLHADGTPAQVVDLTLGA